MSLWRRRRKTALVVIAVLLLGLVLATQVLRQRVESYTAGDQPEGLVDKLARGVPENHPEVVFTSVAEGAGIRFTHFPGTRTNRLPEDMGSGVALGDVDGDGWTDAFLVNTAAGEGESRRSNGDGRSRLFLNRGGGQFEDATDASGIDLQEGGMGAAFCDVDSDGDLDLFVTTFGTCHLYLNDGEGRYRDHSTAAGLDGHEGFWTGIAVADYDLDGAVDVYVCGYVVYDEEKKGRGGNGQQYGTVIPALINPSTFDAERNLLLAGNGDGTFREVSEQAGVANRGGRSLGAIFCDLNADGRPDLYVANDVSDNALFLNRGDGTFLDSTAQALIGDYRGAMGLAAGDFDNDLDLDLFITHWVAQENALYVGHDAQPGEAGAPAVPLFIDRSSRYGLGHVALKMVGWATRFFDYDNDGRLDLFVVNGSTIPENERPEDLEPMRSQLFWNAPDEERFYEVGAVSGEFFREAHVGRGGATFDYDLDGDEDLVVMLHGEPAVLLRNDGGNAQPCVRLRLRQEDGNRFALGARIQATIGDRSTLEVLGSQGSYLSQHAVGEVAFGLGSAAEVLSFEVVWPDGERESMGPVLAHSLVTWTRGERPRVEPFPGRRELDARGPATVAGKRSFYDLRDQALEARIRGEPESAVALYRRALALWPGHADCLYYLGNSLLALGEEAAALEVFERLVHFEEQSSAGWMQIGFLCLPGGDAALDDLARAEAAFRRSHELNGEESRPVLQLGVVAMLSDDLERAELLLAQAGALNPRCFQSLWLGGRVAWLRGDLEQSAELLARAHEVALDIGEEASVSSEGDTESGQALTSNARIPLDPMLTRWRTCTERPIDVELEYGAER